MNQPGRDVSAKYTIYKRLRFAVLIQDSTANRTSMLQRIHLRLRCLCPRPRQLLSRAADWDGRRPERHLSAQTSISLAAGAGASHMADGNESDGRRRCGRTATSGCWWSTCRSAPMDHPAASDRGGHPNVRSGVPLASDGVIPNRCLKRREKCA
jgi:hypothetical protein